jgi:DUF4097 and DUF4098 domain-containing protein YvlB
MAVKEKPMKNEKKRILEMLSKKKITVDEAERLLSALGEGSGNGAEPSRKTHPKYLRVQVEPAGPESQGERVNIRVPMNLIRAGLKWVSFIPKEVQGKMKTAFMEKGIDVDFNKLKADDLEELVQNLNDLEVEVDGHDKVRVYCE